MSFRAPFLSFKQDWNNKKILQYVDIVGLVSFLSPFGFALMWSAWDSPFRVTTLIFKTLYLLFQAYPTIYPTNFIHAFAVVCSWRIRGVKINDSFWIYKKKSDFIQFSPVHYLKRCIALFFYKTFTALQCFTSFLCVGHNFREQKWEIIIVFQLTLSLLFFF